jgi:hypothetical protein
MNRDELIMLGERLLTEGIYISAAEAFDSAKSPTSLMKVLNMLEIEHNNHKNNNIKYHINNLFEEYRK